MADRIRFAVSAIPIETIADENAGTHDIIASEVGTSLGASGDSVDLTNYTGLVANQGFKDGAVGYKDTAFGDGTVPTELTATDAVDFIYIENTGRKYSSSSVLGAVTADCIAVAVKEIAWASSSQGGYTTSSNAGRIRYYGIAWLKPGEGIVIPVSASIAITKMGGNAGDFRWVDQGGTSESDSSFVIKTFASDGGEATDGNAIKFLAVT